MSIRLALFAALFSVALGGTLFAADDPAAPKKEDAPKKEETPKADAPPPRRESGDPFAPPGQGQPGFGGPRRGDGEAQPPREGQPRDGFQPREGGFGPRRPEGNDPNGPRNDNRGPGQFNPGGPGGPGNPGGFGAFQHIGILSLEFHVDKLSRPLL